MKFKAFFVALLILPAMAGNTQDHSGHSMTDHSEHMKMAMAGPTVNAHDILVGFELQAADGSGVTIKDYKDKYLLLGFGFTHCEFVCPTMVANIANVIRSAEVPLNGIFISVDTERDTPLITHRYTQGFIRVSMV